MLAEISCVLLGEAPVNVFYVEENWASDLRKLILAEVQNQAKCSLVVVKLYPLILPSTRSLSRS